ncbi:hypothetical protein TSAR_016532 [Trichomalopsis sarcophagae]|uniref:Uncharacterized protein n=1 Tax=Trichomalopsis sarcophagae TaxID=543379 RepID=A0A232EED5_9HYME|nr:hypothetical protein TSAR_016532 [Trichomalopsis sarcophagae]
MRTQFVKLNLKKTLREHISNAQQNFYEHMIFLEDYISHKNADTFHTPNSKEIILRCYNQLMGNTEEPVDPEIVQANHDESRDSDSSDYLQNYTDVRFLFANKDIVDSDTTVDSNVNADTTVDDEVLCLSDTEELEILKGYEYTVFEKLTADTKKDCEDLQVLPQPLIFEEKSEEKVMPSVRSKTKYCSSESKQLTFKNIESLQVLPHPLSFKENAEEKLVSVVRSKNEDSSKIYKFSITV